MRIAICGEITNVKELRLRDMHMHRDVGPVSRKLTSPARHNEAHYLGYQVPWRCSIYLLVGKLLNYNTHILHSDCSLPVSRSVSAAYEYTCLDTWLSHHHRR